MTTYEWKPLPDGFVLVELVQYDQADQMPKTEETILGGCTQVDEYYCGYVMYRNEQLHFITRFDLGKAKDDVIVRLSAMGYTINIETPTEA